MTTPTPGELWDRRDGSERFRIDRVWPDQQLVRIAPLEGGPMIIGTLAELEAQCTPVTAPPE